MTPLALHRLREIVDERARLDAEERLLLDQLAGDDDNRRTFLGVKELAFLGDMSTRTANRFAKRHGVKVQGIWRVAADVLAREMANSGKPQE
jgi:hypothetical protein